MAATPRTRTPRSAKIPQWPIEVVIPIVQALADLAGPASNARIAQQLQTSPAGGKFRSKLGTAGYYGFVRKQGEMNHLTPRGEALIGDDEAAALTARREAVMSTTFGQVIRKFVSREPNERTIAARLEDDFGSPTASAEYQAETLVKAAREAGLISNGRFDAAAIESIPVELTPASPETNGAEPQQRREPPQQRAKEPKEQRQPEQRQPEQRQKVSPQEVIIREEKSSPFAPAVQVVVKIDASGWTPEQVVQLVKGLTGGEQKPRQTS
jgi:hypothetical protein